MASAAATAFGVDVSVRGGGVNAGDGIITGVDEGNAAEKVGATVPVGGGAAVGGGALHASKLIITTNKTSASEMCFIVILVQFDLGIIALHVTKQLSN